MKTKTSSIEADEEQFSLLVNCIKDYAIFMIDPDGIIISWNKGAQRIKGYSSTEAIGQHMDIFYTKADLENKVPAKNLARAKKRGSYESEGWRVSKDGSLFWADVIFTAVYNADKTLTGFAKVTRDTTKTIIAEAQIEYLENIRRTAAIAISELNEGLEMKVKLRTEELEDAVKELEGFSYSVSHDLRSPLRAINGYANMLQEDYTEVLDDEGKRMLSQVRDGAKKMGVLIDDLLSFFRMGRQMPIKRPVDMDILVKIVLNEINMVPHHAHIIVHPLDMVQADPNLMISVMTNLISNAVKYSSKKEKPVVEISSKTEKGKVIYTIKDNGAGFEMKYMHKLFGVFQRLHSNEEFEGTGVGLAIVQRIINKHRGRVWAEGEPDMGASFHFSLPE